MNEASNFCDGACDSQSTASNTSTKTAIGFDPVNPPYQINNQNSKQVLKTKTIDMNAVHYGGVPEYNAHNLFGELDISEIPHYNYFHVYSCLLFQGLQKQ